MGGSIETKAFFDMTKQDPLYDIIKSLLIKRARNPNPGSNFEKETADIRHLPDDELLKKLEERNYDVLLGFKDGGICNYFAYQRHGCELHVFSVNTVEEYRGQGLVCQFTDKFIDYARDRNAKWIQLSDGNNEDVGKVVKKLAGREKECNIKVDMETCRIELL